MALNLKFSAAASAQSYESRKNGVNLNRDNRGRAAAKSETNELARAKSRQNDKAKRI